MRKRIISLAQAGTIDLGEGQEWLPLEHIATTEVTSEDSAHPVEAALLPNRSEGWQAAGPGMQQVRILFDTPQQVQRIHLHFIEAATARTQEFVLRYSTEQGESFREIVRQQWNFSPEGAMHEVENYQVELTGVTTIELVLVPNISGGNAYASLAVLRLGA